jgi:hypothetical protein
LGKAQKTLLMRENTDVELPKFQSNNTSIPIVLTENDSIINTVNIDEDIVRQQQSYRIFLSDLKNENDPIVIEYDPENSKKIILRQLLE